MAGEAPVPAPPYKWMRSLAVQSLLRGQGHGAATRQQHSVRSSGVPWDGADHGQAGMWMCHTMEQGNASFQHAGHRVMTLVMVCLGAASKITAIDMRICFIGSCFSRVTQEI